VTGQPDFRPVARRLHLDGMGKVSPASVRHLQVFCTAARLSSFKRAAQQLFLTPSAVSHRVRELEASLGVALFERRTRAVALTEVGRTLFDEVAPLLDSLEQSLASVAHRLQRQRLRVTAPQFFSSEYLIPRLSGFSARWPQVDLRLESTEARPTTHPTDADAAIVLASQRPQGVRAVALLELRVVATCSPKYRSALGPPGTRLPPEATLLVHRSWPDSWTRWTRATGIAVPPGVAIVEFDTMFSLLRGAEHGLGLALAPAHLTTEWLRRGSLIRFDEQEVALGDTYWFTAGETDLKRPEVRAFRDWVLTEFSDR